MAFTPDERRVREAEATLIRQVQVLQASAVRGEVQVWRKPVPFVPRDWSWSWAAQTSGRLYHDRIFYYYYFQRYLYNSLTVSKATKTSSPRRVSIIEVLDHSLLLHGSRIPGREARPNFPQLRTALTTVILAKNLVCGVSLSHGGKKGGWVVRKVRVAAEGEWGQSTVRSK